jgi:hypothetical protein
MSDDTFASPTPLELDDSRSISTNTNAYVPVRVTGGPRSDGSMLVYLTDGTALIVNSRYVKPGAQPLDAGCRR